MAIIVDSLFKLDIAGYLKFSSYQAIIFKIRFMQNIGSHLINTYKIINIQYLFSIFINLYNFNIQFSINIIKIF